MVPLSECRWYVQVEATKQQGQPATYTRTGNDIKDIASSEDSVKVVATFLDFEEQVPEDKQGCNDIISAAVKSKDSQRLSRQC